MNLLRAFELTEGNSLFYEFSQYSKIRAFCESIFNSPGNMRVSVTKCLAATFEKTADLAN
jgi:hypothetical protein